ncbi:hypothetical protein TNCV_3172511 [Trichonephila clavipes]|nr:hypothetical protein TNCV_3172511 [Trichonephila clavipes]
MCIRRRPIDDADINTPVAIDQLAVNCLEATLSLGSNPGEDMNESKCIVPLRHWGTLNSRRAASPLVR